MVVSGRLYSACPLPRSISYYTHKQQSEQSTYSTTQGIDYSSHHHRSPASIFVVFRLFLTFSNGNPSGALYVERRSNASNLVNYLIFFHLARDAAKRANEPTHIRTAPRAGGRAGGGERAREEKEEACPPPPPPPQNKYSC